ncbi:MAG: hypothetical protein HZC26_03965 [Candidatus Magasanikbacteria bacterium]|nr:hypothetical protein [Candidatus Magasanikbacteria bacterium]
MAIHEGEPRRENERSVTVYFDLMRHSNRFAGKGEWTDPMTGEVFKWDDTENLTPEGKKVAQDYGANQLPEDVDFVVSVASREPRAGETAGDIESGSKQGKRSLGPNTLKGVTYKELSPDASKVLKVAKPLIEVEAAKHPSYGRLDQETRSKVRQTAQEVGLRYAIENEGMRKEIAEVEAFNLWLLRDMARGAQKGTDKSFKTAMPIVTHGLFNEALLLEALDIIDEESGERRKAKDVDELGGFFAPAESFRIKLENDGKSEKYEYGFVNPERQKKFTGKRLELDWSRIKELAQDYEKRTTPDAKPLVS